MQNSCEVCGQPCVRKACPGECRRERRRREAEIYNRANAKRIAERQRIRRLENPTSDRAQKLAWKYGLTIEDVNRMLAEQDGACKICKTTFERTPCIDHDHRTGANRGLLCGSCNSGLGYFKDDPVRLAAAITYLG